MTEGGWCVFSLGIILAGATNVVWIANLASGNFCH